MTGYNTTIFWNLIVQLLLCLFWGRWCNKLYHKKKAAPVHEAPALRGVRRRVGPLGVFVRSLSLQFLQEAVPVPVQKPFLWTSYIIAREKKMTCGDGLLMNPSLSSRSKAPRKEDADKLLLGLCSKEKHLQFKNMRHNKS
jgi:hypothetical protein